MEEANKQIRREIEIGRYTMKRAQELAGKLRDQKQLAAALFELLRQDYIAFETLQEIVEAIDNA